MENKYNNKYGNIMVTNDYDEFKIINGNRNVDESKVRKLMVSMEEKQLVIPVLVNENYEIIDGQHRFTACSRLGLPIYYIVVEGYGIEEVKKANLIATTWDLEAFLNLYCSNEKEDYLLFNTFIDEYKLSIFSLLGICHQLSGTSLKKLQSDFKTGEFKFDGIEDKVLDMLESLEMFEGYKSKRNSSFLKAYSTLYGREEFDVSIMKEQMEKLGYKLEEKFDKTKDGFLDVLTNKIYSYRPGGKNKLTYDRGTKDFYVRKK